MILLFALVLLAGAAVTMQAGVNLQLREGLGNPFQAGLISFAVGALTMAVVTLPQEGLRWDSATLTRMPWWVWTGGVFGAYLVTVSVLLAPRLGSSTLMGLLLTGQMITALTLDHYGLLGFPVQRLSAPRVIGVLLLMAGVFLIRKY